MLGSVVPPFTHAFELIKSPASAPAPELLRLLEAVNQPAFIMDRKLKLVAFNGSGRRLLDRSCDVSLRDGGLRLSSLKAQAFVEQAARRLALGEQGDMPRHFILPGTAGRVLLRAWPVTNHGNARGEFELRDLPPPLLCVTAVMLDEREPAKSDLAARLFGLTVAEARLAQAIASGVELRDYADAHQVSVHTARNQLKSVFSKMAVSRQVELALLMQKLQR